nr:hypothetical protein [Tanacetum cinerariifolium]
MADVPLCFKTSFLPKKKIQEVLFYHASLAILRRLGLRNLRSVNMVIEMADRSMQSTKGIIENVLVRIHKFIFRVDFVILDIVEDNKVSIILERPILATTHSRIDVFGGNFLLEVGKEQVIFNANEGATPITILPVYVIINFDVIDDIDRPDDLEEFLMNDNLNEDLGNFLQGNNLFPNYEDPGTNSPSLNKSSREIWNPTKEIQDSDNNFGIIMDNLVAIDNLWDDLDPRALNIEQPLKPEFHNIGNIVNRAAYNSIMKREFIYTGNNIAEKAKNL